jgi:hypothetical protein
MTRMGDEAINYARGRVGGTMPQAGYCLAFTRECFAVGSYYASAIDAAHGAEYPHPGDRNIPPATPVYFSSSSVYDHVAFYISDNEVITTWNADVKSMSMNQMLNSYGPYRGWAEDINTVYIMPTVAPPPQESDEVARLLRHPNGTVAMVGPGAAFQVLHNGTQMDTLRATGQVTGDIIQLADGLIWNTAIELAKGAELYTP